MSLNKVNYVSNETIITDENLNEIQDSVVALETNNVEIQNSILNIESELENANYLPTFENADEGKFLRIVNNEAIWTTVQSAEEIEF